MLPKHILTISFLHVLSALSHVYQVNVNTLATYTHRQTQTAALTALLNKHNTIKTQSGRLLFHFGCQGQATKKPALSLENQDIWLLYYITAKLLIAELGLQYEIQKAIWTVIVHKVFTIGNVANLQVEKTSCVFLVSAAPWLLRVGD